MLIHTHACNFLIMQLIMVDGIYEKKETWANKQYQLFFMDSDQRRGAIDSLNSIIYNISYVLYPNVALWDLSRYLRVV